VVGRGRGKETAGAVNAECPFVGLGSFGKLMLGRWRISAADWPALRLLWLAHAGRCLLFGCQRSQARRTADRG
jgi:hypothetical protein